MPDPKDRNAPDNPAPADAQEPLATAADLEKIVETTAKHKEEEQRQTEREAEKKKKAELEALRRPVTISEQETKRLVEKFRAAAEQELSEYVIFSFPAKVLEDGGRAINNSDPEWPTTLVGQARGYYDAWEKYLKDKGYKIGARVSEFDADGLIEEISLFIAW